jgi:hypothetical protein
MKHRKLTRREFVKVGTTGTAALLWSDRSAKGAEPPMPERPLGKTGHNVRLFSLGGQATIENEGTLEESVAMINRAIDLGVNYIDTAAAYGRGVSSMITVRPLTTRSPKRTIQ